METAVGRDQICEVEREGFRTLQQVGRSLLEYCLVQSGTGYTPEHPPCSPEGTALTFTGFVESPYFSIVGEGTITRAAYAGDAQASVYPLDAPLNLPAHTSSYLLETWVVARATETDVREAVDTVQLPFPRNGCCER